MSIQELRSKLITEIKNADESELKDILKFYQIAKQQKEDNTAWKNISELHKAKITNGIQQLKEGKTIPASKLIPRLNKKYGIA